MAVVTHCSSHVSPPFLMPALGSSWKPLSSPCPMVLIHTGKLPHSCQARGSGLELASLGWSCSSKPCHGHPYRGQPCS